MPEPSVASWMHRVGALSRTVLVVMVALLGPASRTAGKVLTAPPSQPDVKQYYLFYEHGKIVEGSSGRPVSPSFGTYDYPAIVEALAERGFVVISRIRAAGADVHESAARLASAVEKLLDAGVPPQHITLVGASKGGLIVLAASQRLHQRELRVAVLAGFFQGAAGQTEFEPWGAVLSIHDRADQGIRPELFLDGAEGVSGSRVVVTDLDLGHGLVYQPHAAWVDEVVRWSGVEFSGR